MTVDQVPAHMYSGTSDTLGSAVLSTIYIERLSSSRRSKNVLLLWKMIV